MVVSEAAVRSERI